MAEAIFSGMLKSGFKEENIILFDIDKNRLDSLKNKYGVNYRRDARELIEGSDIIILAVKPQMMISVCQEISQYAFENKIVVSIVAGIGLEGIKRYLKTNKMVRVMPNTPALISRGISALCLYDKKYFLEEDILNIEKIFASIGEYAWLEENQFNGVTAVSGSGPAYVYRFVEAFIDSGVLIGLSRELATKLVVETVIGSIYMVKETKESPKTLEGQVTSSGGTTIHGLTAMEKSNFSNSIKDGIKAAFKRAEELGK